DSAACLVSGEHDISAHLERLLKQAGQNAPERKPILEINPEHPLLARVRDDDAHMDDWSRLLFEQATLAEGGQLEDPAGFVRRMNAMLVGGESTVAGASDASPTAQDSSPDAGGEAGRKDGEAGDTSKTSD